MSSTAAYSVDPFSLYEKNGWAYPDSPQTQPLKTYEETAKKIINDYNDCAIELDQDQLTEYIKKFNENWTSVRIRKNKISKCDQNTIKFNSYNKYAWLSNFFFTLIYDHENKKLLPHVEAGYVLFKSQQASDQDTFDSVLKMFDPKQIKKIGKHLDRPDGAIKEMKRLVTLKVEQNPVIKNFLRHSKKCHFQEFTSDPFWGTAYDTINSDESNQLGKIWEEVRDNLPT